MRLFYFLEKELLQLRRDLHGLALLFAMPAVFILVMSLALQNQFNGQGTVEIEYYLVDHDKGEASARFIQSVLESPGFHQLDFDADASQGENNIEQYVSQDEAKFLIIVNAQFESALAEGENVIQLLTSPSATPTLSLLIESRLRGLLGRQYMRSMVPEGSDAVTMLSDAQIETLVVTRSLYQGQGDQQRPSSVQQSVPAWLLFSMFFIAIPLSTTLIQERSQRTLARLHTMAFSPFMIFVGKLVPYMVVNLVQVVIMFLFGLYVVPLLGGDQLTLGNSPFGLLVMAVSTSFAAVCYGLLIAQIADTTEQATVFAGVCNIIMAAFGGIMVPIFIMPPIMQDIARLSPMAWGLEGYLDILLRNGDVKEILPEAISLAGFGLVLLAFSMVVARRRTRTP